MILGMGPFELIVIVLVVLVIFGPKNLPKLGKSLGQTVKNVREGMEEGSDDKKDEKSEEAAKDAEAEDVVEESADVRQPPVQVTSALPGQAHRRLGRMSRPTPRRKAEHGKQGNHPYPRRPPEARRGA